MIIFSQMFIERQVTREQHDLDMQALTECLIFVAATATINTFNNIVGYYVLGYNTRNQNEIDFNYAILSAPVGYLVLSIPDVLAMMYCLSPQIYHPCAIFTLYPLIDSIYTIVSTVLGAAIIGLNNNTVNTYNSSNADVIPNSSNNIMQTINSKLATISFVGTLIVSVVLPILFALVHDAIMQCNRISNIQFNRAIPTLPKITCPTIKCQTLFFSSKKTRLNEIRRSDEIRRINSAPAEPTNNDAAVLVNNQEGSNLPIADTIPETAIDQTNSNNNVIAAELVTNSNRGFRMVMN